MAAFQLTQRKKSAEISLNRSNIAPVRKYGSRNRTDRMVVSEF